LFYFDHNATTPVAPEVNDTFAAALREVSGNASSSHRAGQDARRHLEQARLTVAHALGCSPQEVVFTSGGTESDNLAIFGMARNIPLSDKHVVTTSIEHPAVLEAVRQLAREGVAITITAPALAEIAQAIRPETVLVSVMHANNETGSIQPIRDIARLVQTRRASGQQIFFHSDGVQAFGKVPVDMNELAVDLYSVTAHKIYGPKGVGALFVRRGTPLAPLQFGGRHERGRRPGTENVPGAMALARACELLAFEDHGGMAALRDRFERQLFTALEDIEINAGGSDRLPNTSNVLFRGVSAETMLIALDTAGYAVSTGAACSSGSIEASHVLLAIGRSPEEARSSVRFSFGRTNTGEETDRLAETVIALVQRLRKTRETRHQLVG
jgi:cysteine desulfurase